MITSPAAQASIAGAASALRPAPQGRLHYDYANQAWIEADGRVARCGHVTKSAGCYACQHAGESHTCHEDCA